MTEFRQFLDSLARGLALLERRIATPGGMPVVRKDANASEGATGEILVGVGRIGATGAALCLNNKGAADTLGLAGPIASVTDLVLMAPASLIDGWRGALGPDLSPEALLGRLRLVVEDASPDSCFGLLCCLARLADVPPERVPDAWVRYMTAWEQGHTQVTTAPEASYGVLHNALVHLSIQTNPARAWLDGLQLLREALAGGDPPTAMRAESGGPATEVARAALVMEAQAYEDNLRYATLVQLAVPLAGFPQRRRTVDACITDEVMPFGDLKVFARADRARSPLGHGFTLLALHRPDAAGTGNDMVFSVDPASRLDLRELWTELERIEDASWGPARPNDTPRGGMQGYPDGRRADGRKAPNQPWYDGGNYTLLAPPKRLTDGRLGTMVTWPQARAALWAVYHPFRHALVKAGCAGIEAADSRADLLRPIHQCFPEPLGEPDGPTAQRLIVASWHRPDNTAPAFHVTPTLCRYLAACLVRPPQSRAEITLDELPGDEDYVRLDLPGGIAVVTQSGAFVLDGGIMPGRAASQRIGELVNAFRMARDVLQEMQSSRSKVEILLAESFQFLQGTSKETDEMNLLHRVAEMQRRLRQRVHELETALLSPPAQRFRDTLLAHWGMQSWLSAISRDVDAIRDSLNSRTEQLIGRRVAFLQAYGLPVAAAASMFGFVFAGIAADLTWPPRLGAINWQGLILFMLAIVAGSVLVRLVTWWTDRPLLRPRSSTALISPPPSAGLFLRSSPPRQRSALQPPGSAPQSPSATHHPPRADPSP